MGGSRILVVDDEPAIVKTMKAYLEAEGYLVESAGDGETALSSARSFLPDLVILDIMLPGVDGLEVLRRLRQESDVYVLLLTAKTEETDRIIGLGLGADDYVVKPFSPREVVARVKAMLRRARGVLSAEALFSFRGLRIDVAARKVWKGDLSIDLTPIEFEILVVLARFRGRVLTRGQLLEEVWGQNYYGEDRVVDAHMRRLRSKIEDDPARPSLIVTVRGAGYRFEGQSE